MYLHGLKALADDDYSIFTGDMPVDIPDPVPDRVYTYGSGDVYNTTTSPSEVGPTSTADWTGIFKTALTTWGNVTVSKQQRDAQIELAKRGFSPSGYPYYVNPQTGGAFPLAPSAISTSGGTVLLLGTAALAAYFIFKG